jgi:Cu(I)/Ag(I) efflux system protein CusF
MKKVILSAFTLMFLSAASVSSMAADEHQHSQNVMPKHFTAKGEVKAIDSGAGKIQLKHSPVPELEWPAMTMYFPVSDKSLLKEVKVGQQVEFVFVNINTGPTIIDINPTKQ